MIGSEDIERALAQLLSENGFLVVPVDVRDGFRKPACSIDVFPCSCTALSWYVEEDSFTVDITYYPEHETQEELIRSAEILKKTLLYTPLQIEKRVVDTNRVEMAREGMEMHIFLEYTLEQNPHGNEDYADKMEDLNLEME